MEQGLDLQHSAYQRGGGADPTAPFQVHQVIHGEPVAQVQTVFQTPVVNFLKGHSLYTLLAGVPDEQTLAHGGAQGIHHPDGAVGILLGQLFGGNDGGLVGGGQTGREGQHQHVLPLLEGRFHEFSPAAGVYGGGLSGFSCPQTVVHFLQAVVVLIVKGIAPELHGQGHKGQPKGFIHGRGEITAGIGDDLIIHIDTLRYSRQTASVRANMEGRAEFTRSSYNIPGGKSRLF